MIVAMCLKKTSCGTGSFEGSNHTSINTVVKGQSRNFQDTHSYIDTENQLVNLIIRNVVNITVVALCCYIMNVMTKKVF